MGNATWIEILLAVIALEMAVLVVFLLKTKRDLKKKFGGPKWPSAEPFKSIKKENGEYAILSKKYNSIEDILDLLACRILELHAQSVDHFKVTHEQLNNLIMKREEEVPIPTE